MLKLEELSYLQKGLSNPHTKAQGAEGCRPHCCGSGLWLGPGDHTNTWWVNWERAHPWRGKRKWFFYEVLNTYSFIKLLFHLPPRFNYPLWVRNYVCFEWESLLSLLISQDWMMAVVLEILNSEGFTFLRLSKYFPPSRPVLSVTSSRTPPHNQRPVCLEIKVSSSRTYGLHLSPWCLFANVFSFSNFPYV